MALKRKGIFILVLAITFLFGENAFGQLWPYAPMIRFGITVYLPIDSLSPHSLYGIEILFHNGIEGRYFDTDLKSDSVTLNIQGERFTFFQRRRDTVKINSRHLYYSRRFLRCKKNNDNYVKITYMKLLEITPDSLKFRCTLRGMVDDKSMNGKVETYISKNQLTGLFIGL